MVSPNNPDVMVCITFRPVRLRLLFRRMADFRTAFVFLAVAFLLIPLLVSPAQAKMMADSVVIFEVCIGGGSTSDEFISLYNPTPDSKGLGAYRIARRTSTGTASNWTTAITLSVGPPADTIGPFGFFRIVLKTALDAKILATADTLTAGAVSALAASNQIMFGEGSSSVNFSDSRDRLGWGTLTDYTFTETDLGKSGTLPALSSAGQSIYRKPGLLGGGMIDRQDNSNDFNAPASSDTFNTASQHRRTVFDCDLEAGVNVTVNTAFTLYCTATVVLGDTYFIQDTNVLTYYTGDSAWADLTGWGKDTLTVSTSGDTVDTTGIFANGLCTMTLKFTGGSGTQRLVLSDAYCTGVITFTLTAQNDTIGFKLANLAVNSTYETSNATFTITGNSSGDSQAGDNWDSVFVTFDGVDTHRVFHSETGVWSCSGNFTFRDTNGGVKVVAYLLRNGARSANDTLTVVYDGMKPRITKIGDTSTKDGDTVSNADKLAFFYVYDTGAAFGGSGECTLYYHIDSGGNTNYKNGSSVTYKNNTSGTWTIEATLAFGYLTVDTKAGFWWECRDDVNNNMDSTSLSPAYIAANPGTVAISSTVVSVRDVVISEIMWAENDMEYIELYNTLPKSVDIAGWKVCNLTTCYTIPAGETIPAKEYYVVHEGGALNDVSRHYEYTQEPISLTDAGDSVGLLNGSGTAIDSAPFSSGWPAGRDFSTSDDDTQAVSMERKLTGTTNWTAGYGGTASQWDSNTLRHGAGNRPHGTPGHANSINVPNLTSITPSVAAVQKAGRGEWVIRVTNGPNAFSSNNGRVIVQTPSGWSSPKSSTSDSGYTTIGTGNGAILNGSPTFTDNAVTARFTAFPANGFIDLDYGDASGGRGALAQVSFSKGMSEFQLFYDTDGTDYFQVGDSSPFGDTAFYSVRGCTVNVVSLDTYVFDTNPSANPQSFLGSEYQILWTVSDSLSRKVYGAHVTADTDGSTLGAHTDTMFPHLSEFGSFTGNYEPSGTLFRGVSGWTNTSGEFQFTIKVTDTQGATIVNIRDTDVTAAASALIYTDSTRLPNPVINEIGWAGSTANCEYVEIYNPTHGTQDLSGFKLLSGQSRSSAAVDIGTADFNTVGVLNPFQYAIIMEKSNTVQDSGPNNLKTATQTLAFTNAAPAETIYLQNSTADTVDFGGADITGLGWFNDADGGGVPDGGDSDALERIYPNRTGILSSSWAASDSPVNYFPFTAGTNGKGSPGRPNAQSLARSLSKLNILDTIAGRVNGTTMDTARIVLTLKIASGDTQPYQRIGVLVAVDKGPVNYGSIGDSSWLAAIRDATTPESTTAYGTGLIQVSANSNNVSGTVHVRVVQPYGFPDTAYLVFDRGDSLGYTFQASETNLMDTSAANALLVYVGFSDTFSGLDTSILPRFCWKIGSAGSCTSFSSMTLFTGDTYLARVDISSNSYAIKTRDTIYWRVNWRDKAGNWDTSPDNNVLSSEFIDNTRGRDTIVSPTFSDTLTGSNALIRLKIIDQSNDFCTITVKYDSYSSGIWTNVSLGSGSDTKTNLRATTAGETLDLRWNTSADLGTDSTIASVRLRIEVFDGFDTHTDTSGFFGVTNTSTNNKPYDTIILPADGDTYGGDITVRFVLVDADGQYCTVAIQYTKDSGTAWLPATITGTVSNLLAPAIGDTFTVTWNSKTDVPDTKLPTFKMRISANDKTDTGSADTTLVFGIDNQKPSVLDTLTAVADVDSVAGSPDTGVYLTWNRSSTSDSKGYNVYRGAVTDSRLSSKINSFVLTDTYGYKDTTVSQGDTYYYYVVVVDTYNNESDSSKLEAAPNLEVIKTISDSSNPKGLRPGDTIYYRITVRNNGFAPAETLVLYDYAPSNTIFNDTVAAASVLSSWTIHYRVAGASSADVWQTPRVDSATLVRFTRANRMDPNRQTPSDTLTIKIKIQ